MDGHGTRVYEIADVPLQPELDADEAKARARVADRVRTIRRTGAAPPALDEDALADAATAAACRRAMARVTGGIMARATAARGKLRKAGAPAAGAAAVYW